MRRRALGCAALALAILGSSCTFSNLSFRTDNRIKIVAPADRADVRPPFTLRWTARDFDSGPGTLGSDDDYFMVFVDRQPMRPGGTVKSLGDDTCRRQADCPNEQWLNDHWIFVTTSTSLDLRALPNLLPTTTRSGTKEDHSITIILMHGDRRIGEAGFTVDFYRTIRQ